MRGFRYFRPASITWWAGFFLIVMGFAQAAGWPTTWQGDTQGVTGLLAALTAAVAALTGGIGADTSPAALIGIGFGMIGLRDAIQREGDFADAMAEARMIETRADFLSAVAAREMLPELEFGDDEDDLPPGVRDPYGPGGSRE